MAITVTQTTAFDANKDGTGTSYTYTVTATAASALLIAAIMDKGAPGGSRVTSMSDNKSGGSNSWTQICRGDSAVGGGAAIYATAATAGSITTFTTTLTGAGGICVQFYEVAGANAADVNHTNSGVASTISSGSSGTLTGSNDLVIGVGGLSQGVFGPTISSPAFTTAGGTFVSHNSAGTSTAAVGYVGRLILSGSTTAQTFTFNDDGNGATWGACIAAWQAASTTNIKTIGGLAKASVKTVAGLPIASVKTIEGLA